MARRIGRPLKDRLHIEGTTISHEEMVDRVILYIDERDKRSVKDYIDQLKLEGITVKRRAWHD